MLATSMNNYQQSLNLLRKFTFIIILFSAILYGNCAGQNGDAAGAPSPSSPRRREYEAIQFLHQMLDEDLSGYIDIKESDEFLHDELKVQGRNKERLSNFHNDDPQITVDELWKSWSSSEVHNWTTDQVVEWLQEHVELPQYSENFRRNNINGSQLPRMASNSPEFLASTLGIRDPIHKRKVALKATDAVLFGSPKSRDMLSKYKEYVFIFSLLIASFGVWIAYSQRRKYESQMQHMAADLERIKALEKDLAEMQNAEGTVAATNMDDAMSLSPAERERLEELNQENIILREALERAEHRVQSTQWYPPVDLELVLQKTYAVELQYFRGKRTAAEKQLHSAKEECEKLHKKQQSFVGAFRAIHGSSMNLVDDQLSSAKTALSDLASDINDRTSRWTRIENLTGFHIIQPAPADAQKVRDARRRSIDFDDSASVVHGFNRESSAASSLSSRLPQLRRLTVASNFGGESFSDNYSVYAEELRPSENYRRAPKISAEFGAVSVSKENGLRRLDRTGSDLDLQRRAGRIDESLERNYRRAPDNDFIQQSSYDSESSGRQSPPTGPVDNDQPNRKVDAVPVKKPLFSLLAMKNKKSEQH